jgi:hypothetical protein
MNVEVKFNSALIISFWCQNLCIQNSHAILEPLQQDSYREISNIWSDKWIMHYENALSYTVQIFGLINKYQRCIHFTRLICSRVAF